MHEGELNVIQVLQSKVELREEGEKVILDITDHTGGLAYKLSFDPVVANSFGQRISDLARAIFARSSGDPIRTRMQEFEADIAEGGN